jgi:uncharacterized membrane protein YkvA (DUF1232 family)
MTGHQTVGSQVLETLPLSNALKELMRIVQDEKSAEEILAQIREIGKEISQLVLVALLYEAAVHAGYGKGGIRKAALVSMVLLYTLSPIDIFPDVIPVLGQVDDMVVIMLAFRAYMRIIVGFAQDVVNRKFSLESIPLYKDAPPAMKQAMSDACVQIAQQDNLKIERIVRLLSSVVFNKGTGGVVNSLLHP